MADPTEKKGTWTTPVFWFLKGVEGFDTSRANDCAKKLNDKHYDTIAVLKLAEKRDLIEDAGILPGDALRIVVAARAYVAPTPAPCDPPFRPGASPRPVKRYQKHSRPSESPIPQHHHDAITTALEHLKAYQAACIATASLTPARASDSTSQQQPGASQSTSPKYESWGSDLTLRALPQQQPGASASIFQAVPQQPRASDSTAIPQQPPPGISYSTFRASPQQKGAAVSQLVAPKSEPVTDPTLLLQSTIQALPQQQQPGASDATLQAFPQPQKGAAVSQQVASKSEAVKDSTVPHPSIIQAVPQQQPIASVSTFKAVPQQQPPNASNSTLQSVPQQQPGASDSAPQQQPLRASNVAFRAVPQQQQARASDPILQASLQAPIEEQHASFQAYVQQLQGSAVSQHVAPNSEPVKNPTVPLPSITQAFLQQQARASDPTVQTVPQPGAPNTTLQAVPQQQAKASNSTPQASPQQPPKASVVTSQTLSQQQARDSDSTAQSVPHQQPVVSDSTTQGVSQQQQPRLSDPILQASLQATLQKQNASFQAYVQQLHQPKASDSTVQVVSRQQPRASDKTTQAVSHQQQPRTSHLPSHPFAQQQPKASDSSQAVSQEQDGWPWRPSLGDDHPPRAPISTFQAPPQKAYAENCNGFGSFEMDDYGYHGSSQKDNFSDAFGYLGGVRVKPSHLVKYPHICRLCNVKCIGEKQYITHYSCQRHYEALDLREARNPPQAAAQPHSEHPPRTGDGTPEHVCGVCDIWCRSEMDLRSHFNGNKHAKNMKLALDSKDNRHTTYLYCSICDVLCNSKWNLVQHLNGKRHAQNMEEDDSDEDYSEGSSYYSEYS